MSIKDYWRIYCNVENGWTYGWSADTPTQCFNNAVHSVNPNSVSIVNDAYGFQGSNVAISEDDIHNIHDIHINNNAIIGDAAPPAAPDNTHGILYKPTGIDGITWKTFYSSTDLTIGTHFVESITQFDDPGPFSTTSQIYERAVRFNTTSLESGHYRVAWSFLWNSSTASNNTIRVQMDDSVILNEYSMTPPVIANEQRISISGFWYGNLGAGFHYFDFDMKSPRQNKTVSLYNIRLEFMRVRDSV